MDVLFKARVGSGKVKTVGSARLVGSLAVVEGQLPAMVTDMLRKGIPDESGEGRLFIEDGAEFLRALPHVFRGSYFWAVPEVH